MTVHPAKSNPPTKASRALLITLLLGAMTFALYLPVRQAQFLVYDDKGYILDNAIIQQGLNARTVAWAFTSGYASNWHPLTWLSHALDCEIFGVVPRWHHLVNVLFHACNTMLLFLMLRSLTGAFWRAAMVAALFGWHPAHVESVAWIAERKDVLSTFFFLLAIIIYAQHARHGGWMAYAAALAVFALGLLSKPMVVSLPLLLLLLDYWPLKRMQGANGGIDVNILRTRIVEKLPFFILSLLCCVITYAVQWAEGSTKVLGAGIGMRLANAVISCGLYLEKLFVPLNLAAFYPYPKTLDVVHLVLCFAVLAAITWAAVSARRKHPFLIMGWLWFLVSLVPVIGIVQVGKQAMADRYLYIPSIGIFVAVVWLVAEFAVTRGAKMMAGAVSVVALACCLVLTHRELDYWMDSVRLFTRAIEVTKENEMAEHTLGVAYVYAGQMRESLVHLEKAVALDPQDNLAWSDLGLCHANLGEHALAANYFAKALRLNPNNSKAHYNMGMSCIALGDFTNAAHELEQAVKLWPQTGEFHAGLGQAYSGLGRWEDSIRESSAALRIHPQDAESHFTLGVAEAAQGDLAGAAAEYRQAIELQPGDARAFNNLAWLRCASADASLRDGPEAVKLARHACELTKFQSPVFLGTLANALAEAGDFVGAESTARMAIRQAAQENQIETGRRNGELLELYKAGKAYHEPTGK